MDNDVKLVKMIKKAIRNLKFKIDYRGIKILSENEGNCEITKTIKQDSAKMIARCGATEMRCISEYLSPKFNGKFSDKIKKEISELSGVFPAENEILIRFCKEYIKAISESDILALWGVGSESKVVKSNCDKCIFVPLRSLEPYYFKNPWSKALENKKILVIHPFKDSIINQYSIRQNLFDNKDVLPKFEKIECIKAIQTIAGTKSEFSTWFEALEYMKNEISKVDFDIAIIGAGAYGLPLAAYVKSLGKKSIQLSGATQILFGIKGKRWDDHEFISNLYNDYWKRPMDIEKPKYSEKVEGGSYW